jgi:hypothetical protein
MDTFGSRAKVWHNKAKKTRGGLTKKDLKKNKRGRIVSKRKSLQAKRNKTLKKAGYYTVKGKFGALKQQKKTVKKSTKRPNKKANKKK